MKKKIISFLIKLFIRETIIFDIKEYPNYNALVDFGYMMINTYHGNFMFLMKEDVNKGRENSKGKLLDNRYFTVELKPSPDSILSPRENYEDKIMLVVKLGRFYFSKRTIINLLANVYLEKIWKDDESKIETI